MEQSAGNRIKRVNSVFMPKREPRSSCVPTIVEVTREHFVLLSPDWIPLTHLVVAKLFALAFLICGGDIEDRCSITISSCKFLLQLRNVAAKCRLDHGHGIKSAQRDV